MLEFKLIHVSKRGVWQAAYCNMMVADVLMSTQKRTPDIMIHFAEITGVMVSHVCYYRFGLNRIIMRLHNVFYKEMLIVFTVWAPEALTASYGVCGKEFMNCRSGEVMV